MRIIRLTGLTFGGLAAALMYFGRDEGLGDNRIGREPDPVVASVLPDRAAAAAPSAPAADPIAHAVTEALAETPAPELPPVEIRTNLAVMEPLPGSAPLSVAVAPVTREAPPEKVRFVAGSRVNLRAGPSTGQGVVAALSRGTEVVDLGEAAPGWSQIRVVDSGTRGFMATRFLSEVRP